MELNNFGDFCSVLKNYSIHDENFEISFSNKNIIIGTIGFLENNYYMSLL